MCVAHDARPPEVLRELRRLTGAAPDERLELVSADGTLFSAYRAAAPSTFDHKPQCAARSSVCSAARTRRSRSSRSASSSAPLDAAGADHDLHVYPGAPHAFFDRRQDQFADESADAWRRTLAFLDGLSGRAGEPRTGVRPVPFRCERNGTERV